MDNKNNNHVAKHTEYVDIREYIGMQIQERRKKLGLSQVDLAEKCGMIQATVSKIERGRFSVTVDMLQRICEVLNCRIELKPED